MLNIILKFIFILSLYFLCYINAYTQTDNDISFYIEKYTDSTINIARQPGVIVSYTCGDKVVYEKAKGVADIKTKEPMNLDMKWRIGSLTKTFTITILLQLADEGLLNLDETIDKFFPDFPDGNKITVRMLGDMSSGIYAYTQDSSFINIAYANPKRKWKPEELVEYAIKNPPYFEPGKGFQYSNTNTVMGGMIIEKLTGNSLANEIKKRISEKLKLKDTYLAMDPVIEGFHCRGYNDDTESFKEPMTDFTEVFDPSWGWAAGSVVSTLADIKIYTKALAEGTLISKEMQSERLKWATENEIMKYGLGIFRLDQNYLGHNGSYPGFSNISVHSPDTNCTIIIFYNSQTNCKPDHLLIDLLKLKGNSK